MGYLKMSGLKIGISRGSFECLKKPSGEAKQTAVRGTLKKREKGAVSVVSVQVRWIRLGTSGLQIE
jgi:hypothetical protein